MKRLFLLTSLLVAIVAMTVSASAQTVSPVDEFVNKMTSTTETISKATSWDQVDTIGKSADAFFEQYRGSTYPLTDADRQKLTDAFVKFTIVAAEKQAQFSNQAIDSAQLDAMRPMITQQISQLFANKTTLGEIFAAFTN